MTWTGSAGDTVSVHAGPASSPSMIHRRPTRAMPRLHGEFPGVASRQMPVPGRPPVKPAQRGGSGRTVRAGRQARRPVTGSTRCSHWCTSTSLTRRLTVRPSTDGDPAVLVTPMTGRCPNGRSKRAPHLGQTRAFPLISSHFHKIPPAARAHGLGRCLLGRSVGVMWGFVRFLSRASADPSPGRQALPSPRAAAAACGVRTGRVVPDLFVHVRGQLPTLIALLYLLTTREPPGPAPRRSR
jgi:hypothetical protein